MNKLLLLLYILYILKILFINILYIIINLKILESRSNKRIKKITEKLKENKHLIAKKLQLYNDKNYKM